MSAAIDDTNYADYVRQVRNGARFSPCRTYRYELHRSWSMEPKQSTCLWVMLNPSTADEHLDDPTIRRCVNFSKLWGFDSLTVGNLYGYRATKPADMFGAWKNGVDIIGPENVERLRILASYCTRIVCAWGSNADHNHAEDVLMELLSIGGRRVCYLAMNQGQYPQPRHPLYVSSKCVPTFYYDMPRTNPGDGP